MTRSLRLILLTVIAISCMDAPESSKTLMLQGTVFSEFNIPVTDMQVKLSQGNDTVYFNTLADGSFIFQDIQKGAYNISINKSQYHHYNQELTVENSITDLRIHLRPLVSDSLRLIEMRSSVANEQLSFTDTLDLTFNTRILFKSFEKTGNCYGLEDVSYLNDGMTLRIYFNCQRLTTAEEFEISVAAVDNPLNNLKVKVAPKSYIQKMSIEGLIKGHRIDRLNNKVAIITANPNRFYIVSLNDFEVLSSVNLTFEPKKVTVNPLNSLYYLLDEDHPEIAVIDQSGAVKKTIEIKPSVLDNSYYPRIYPMDIEIAKNGVGIVLLNGEDSNAGSYWRILENDSLYLIPEQENSLSKFHEIAQVELDHTGLRFIGRKISSREILMVDAESLALSAIQTPYPSEIQFLLTNSINNLIYIGGYYDYITNLNQYSNAGLISVALFETDLGVDFCYQCQDPLSQYFNYRGYFYRYDYTTGNYPFVYAVNTDNIFALFANAINDEVVFLIRNYDKTGTDLYKFKVNESGIVPQVTEF